MEQEQAPQKHKSVLYTNIDFFGVMQKIKGNQTTNLLDNEAQLQQDAINQRIIDFKKKFVQIKESIQSQQMFRNNNEVVYEQTNINDIIEQDSIHKMAIQQSDNNLLQDLYKISNQGDLKVSIEFEKDSQNDICYQNQLQDKLFEIENRILRIKQYFLIDNNIDLIRQNKPLIQYLKELDQQLEKQLKDRSMVLQLKSQIVGIRDTFNDIISQIQEKQKQYLREGFFDQEDIQNINQLYDFYSSNYQNDFIINQAILQTQEIGNCYQNLSNSLKENEIEDKLTQIEKQQEDNQRLIDLLKAKLKKE